jgi:hypothetical protein
MSNINWLSSIRGGRIADGDDKMDMIKSTKGIAKLAAITIVLLLSLGMIGSVLAINVHVDGSTGQPDKTCGDPGATSSPGKAAVAPGSAFNEVDGIAGSVYAGNNPFAPGFVKGHASDKAVSQYDVACFQVTQNPTGQALACQECQDITIA